jgi:hypothetical protein
MGNTDFQAQQQAFIQAFEAYHRALHEEEDRKNTAEFLAALDDPATQVRLCEGLNRALAQSTDASPTDSVCQSPLLPPEPMQKQSPLHDLAIPGLKSFFSPFFKQHKRGVANG